MTTPTVTATWLHENIEDSDLIILDASPITNKSGLQTEYPGLRIPGARFFDIKNKFSDTDAEMPNTLPSPTAFERECQNLGINQNSKIVVYDNLGIYTSPRVWWMFLAMGHQNIAVLDGGLPEWVRCGFPTEKQKPVFPPKGDFKAKSVPKLKTKMEEVKQNISSKKSIVIDARSGGRFDGTAPEPRQGLSSGHMPGAASLPFPNVLENGKLKSAEELKSVFEKINPQKLPAIFSCGSGLTACILMLAAETVADFPKSVYDGSWTEWAQKQPSLISKKA